MPASKVVIFDNAGNRINDIAGPFNEDSSVNLTCDSEGGTHLTFFAFNNNTLKGVQRVVITAM